MAEEPSAFDLAQIHHRWGGPSDEIYLTILGIFAVEADALCAQARASLADGRRDTLMRVAHTLRGAAANICAIQLAERAGAAEAAALSGTAPVLEILVSDMEAAWQTVKADIAMGGPERYGR